MAPFAFLALLLAAANPDLPIGRTTQPVQIVPAPAATPTAANPAADGDSEVSLAPSDDYGYVAFCYGAESGYLRLYDQVMPEVERIERTFPGSTPVDQALAEYPQLRSESQGHLTAYAAALTAAEQASPQGALAPRGLQIIRQGRSTWDGAALATPAQTARAWMGWAAPEDCIDRATTLADRSRLPGSARQGGGTGQTAVELDRLANPPVLASVAPAPSPALSPAPIATSAPQPLALRGSAPSPIIGAPAPRTVHDPGVSFATSSAASATAGLGVSFDGPTVLPSGAPTASPAIPPDLPPLVTGPSAPAAPDPPPWRGIL